MDILLNRIQLAFYLLSVMAISHKSNSMGRYHLILSIPLAESWAFADGTDQDQTARFMQSDLDLCCPLLYLNVCVKILWNSVDCIYCC